MNRFRPIPLGRRYNSPAKFHEGSTQDPTWHERAAGDLALIPRGLVKSWGIPFSLGVQELERPCIVTLRPQSGEVTVPLSGSATHICFLHLADFPEDHSANAGGGEKLAEFVVRYKNGSEHTQPIRMRFEVNCPTDWGRGAFAAQHASMRRAVRDGDPVMPWGRLQVGMAGAGPHFGGFTYGLELPDSQSELESVTLKPVSGLMAVIGMTLYNGPGHPLRHVPRRIYKLVLPEAVLESELLTQIDMGDIIRTYSVPGYVDEAWLASPDAGLGGKRQGPEPSNEFLIEATGALGATLSVKAGDQDYQIDFGKAFEEGKSQSDGGKARIELLGGRRTWVRVSVIDTSTGKPTPTRIHFRGSHGEYIPPYGHHQVVNENWFEDYGGDLQLGNTSYAYVPGEFQIELPEGDVYVEMFKGFEYAPVRQKLSIRPGQRDLNLGISRWTDQRGRNWVTADTHVHFITPQTAWLEGQAEGLNLINLLASQWGRLFTNVADITGALSGCSQDDTLVWVGTENRNHMLGHISMLGTQGDPVFPMCAGGPDEAFVGDPDQMLLTEWAEVCREREGVVIRPHFPSPICEEPVYMLLEKMDGVELRQFASPENETLDVFHFNEWYRYLNCGCRVAAVGGTDKMSAGMPVGGVRTYAKLDPSDEFSFDNWGKAVRAGRTFTTSGPIMDLTVEGRSIGDEIQLPAGGGTLEVKATAECAWPVHKMEIVVNGKVAASTYNAAGAKQLSLSEKIKVSGSCWIAARCSSLSMIHHCWPIHLGAHTSPVYVVAGGEELFSESDASYMLTLIDGGMTYLDTLSVRFDEDRHLAMKAIFERARQVLHRKMHQQGIGHGH
ncbi:MAG: CehA/McbA family metallohydrolase [Armatimonadota bacterium]|nr:CehA/McbA family metallohydrolase [Armatimonadota bacterium]